MVRPDVSKWGQTMADLREQAIKAEHARTRERFQALYMIGNGQTNATQWAIEVKHTKETVLRWVHRYNEQGPTALIYRRTGGRTPFFARSRRKS